MKYIPLILCTILSSCQSTKNKTCRCEHTDTVSLASQIEAKEKISTKYMTTDEKIRLAAELLNNDASEQALDVLDAVPTNERTLKFKQLRRDAINKTIVNLRYKVRMLYQQSLQQTGRTKVESLKLSRAILEDIVKKFPDYNDMYSIKNNLKQIERELARKS